MFSLLYESYSEIYLLPITVYKRLCSKVYCNRSVHAEFLVLIMLDFNQFSCSLVSFLGETAIAAQVIPRPAYSRYSYKFLRGLSVCRLSHSSTLLTD